MPSDPLQHFFDKNGQRLSAVAEKFGAYQPQPVTRSTLWDWLRQVEPQDYELLIRLAECVHYYDVPGMSMALRQLHRAIRDQLIADGIPQIRRMVFVPPGEPGESGHEILRRYRNVNSLQQTSARLKLVPQLQEVVVEAQEASEGLAVIFLDDFVGTGDQIERYWREVLVQVIPPPLPALYIGTIAACDEGVIKVQSATPLKVIPVHFTPAVAHLRTCPRFTDAEKDRLRQYCGAIGNQPFGYGNLELLLAFTHGSPDNTISLLRGAKGQRKWKGILPGYSDL